jgi:hypothetical protein
MNARKVTTYWFVAGVAALACALLAPTALAQQAQQPQEAPQPQQTQQAQPPQQAPQAQQPRQSQRTGTFEGARSEPTLFRVFPLQYSQASEVENVLRNLLTGERRGGFPGSVTPESVIADVRTNSLIVRGTEEVLQSVSDIVKSLDRPGDDQQQLKVFTLLHVNAESALAVLTSLVGAKAKLALDGASNRVIVQGDPVTLAMVEALLLRLDEPPAERADEPPQEPQASDVQVRVVWLVAGLSDPTDLENVVKELEGMGVSGLKTAAQVFVKTIENTSFGSSGSAVLEQLCHLEVSGTCRQRSAPGQGGIAAPTGAPTRGKTPPRPMLLEITLQARDHDGNEMADLQTTIAAPAGHSVVLGVSPVGPLTSVFVVQLRR